MAPWVRPEPLWVRYPNVGGVMLLVACVALGLLLSGCDCGQLWPCPGK